MFPIMAPLATAFLATPSSAESRLTSFPVRRINKVAGSGGARGDLGQLAPRKKLLKSFGRASQKFSETLRRTLARRVFQFSPPAAPHNSTPSLAAGLFHEGIAESNCQKELRCPDHLKFMSCAVESVERHGAMNPAPSAKIASLPSK